MAKMGGRKQIKRYSMPPVMRLPVKSSKWLTKPIPGPHPVDKSIPLRIIVRDYLKLAGTAKEADRIIFSGKVIVDGVVRRDPRFPVGFMDILEIPDINKTYRVFIDELGRLKLLETNKEEAGKKLCKVVKKQCVRGGKIQLTMHDGRNIVGDLKDIGIGDVIELSVPDGELLKHIPLSENKLAVVTDGQHTGKIGRIEEIKKETKTVRLSTNGEKIETSVNYVFVLGDEKPLVDVGVAA
ncbi:MAG: 30S ribosomal protein S4e [Candidatus Hadarchaeales archaeon]